jgi:hypothetical protein
MGLINRQGFGVVLDVGSAYSLDKSFALARKMLRLKPVHVNVSGASGKKMNCMLSRSDNKAKVLEFLKLCRGAPLIMEMNMGSRNDKVMKAELSLLRSHDKK